MQELKAAKVDVVVRRQLPRGSRSQSLGRADGRLRQARPMGFTRQALSTVSPGLAAT